MNRNAPIADKQNSGRCLQMFEWRLARLGFV